MISVVRFLSRLVFARSIRRSRWVRRIAFVLGVFRFLARRRDNQFEIQVGRDEHIDVVIARNETVKK